MKTKKIAIVICMFTLGCAEEKPGSGEEIQSLSSSNSLIDPRDICTLFADSVFAGAYDVSRIVTDMTPDPLSDNKPLPFSTVTFSRVSNLENPTNAMNEFSVLTRGGEFPEGGSLSADFAVQVGEQLVVFPTKEGDDFKVRDDGMFRVSGDTVSSEYYFKHSPPPLVTRFLSDYDAYKEAGTCSY